MQNIGTPSRHSKSAILTNVVVSVMLIGGNSRENAAIDTVRQAAFIRPAVDIHAA